MNDNFFELSEKFVITIIVKIFSIAWELKQVWEGEKLLPRGLSEPCLWRRTRLKVSGRISTSIIAETGLLIVFPKNYWFRFLMNSSEIFLDLWNSLIFRICKDEKSQVKTSLKSTGVEILGVAPFLLLTVDCPKPSRSIVS